MGVTVTVRVGVAVGVPVMVMGRFCEIVTVPVIPATWVAETTARSTVGVAVLLSDPIRSERIMKAAPTPKAKRATTAMMLTHSQVDRGATPSSSGTMSKSSSSDKER